MKIKRIKLNAYTWLCLTAFLAGIDGVIVVRAGARWQLWVFSILLLVVIFLLKSKSNPVFSRVSLCLIILIVVSTLVSLVYVLSNAYPELSEVQRRAVKSKELRILVSLIRLYLIGAYIFLICYYRQFHNRLVINIMKWFNYGAVFVAGYGIYSFVVSLAGMKHLMLPGTWGTYGSVINSLRSASFFYEPSQFGFFCSVHFLLTIFLYLSNEYTRRQLVIKSSFLLCGLIVSVSGSGIYALLLALLIASVISPLFFAPRIVLPMGVFVLISSIIFGGIIVSNNKQLKIAWKHKYYQAYRLDYFDSAIFRVKKQVENYPNLIMNAGLLGNGAGSAYLYGRGGFYVSYIKEFGVFGILFFVLFCIKCLNVWNNIRKQNRRLKGIYVSVLICFLAGLIKYRDIYQLWIWVIIFFLADGFQTSVLVNNLSNTKKKKLICFA